MVRPSRPSREMGLGTRLGGSMDINAKYSTTHPHAWAIRAVYKPYRPYISRSNLANCKFTSTMHAPGPAHGPCKRLQQTRVQANCKLGFIKNES